MAKFLPGQSGNLRGRPRKTIEQKNIDEACRKHAPQALETLLTLLKDRSPTIRLKAAQIILERGFGKPRQALDIEQQQPEVPTTVIFQFTDDPDSMEIDGRPLTPEERQRYIGDE